MPTSNHCSNGGGSIVRLERTTLKRKRRQRSSPTVPALLWPSPHGRRGRFAQRTGYSSSARMPPLAMPLGLCFVEIVERIFQRHSPDAAEPRLVAQLADLRFMKTKRAESCPIVRERSGHAIKHAYTMKHRA